ncbi:MAG: tetratricopeptide repeat protein [Spirochaetota bacterium]
MPQKVETNEQIDSKDKTAIENVIEKEPINNKENKEKSTEVDSGSKGLVIAIIVIIFIITFFVFITWSVINIRSREIGDISNLISKSQQGNRSLHMLVKFYQKYQRLQNMGESDAKGDLTQEVLFSSVIDSESIEDIETKEEEIFLEPMVREIIKFIDGILGIESSNTKNLYNDILLRKAYLEERNRNYDKAIDIFKEFLDNNTLIGDSLKADIYLHIGFNYAVQNKNQQASEYFNQIYELVNEDTDTYKTAVKIETVMKELIKEQKELKKEEEKLVNVGEDFNLDEFLNRYERFLITSQYDEIKNSAEKFINNNIDRIEDETSYDNKWRIAVAAVNYYWGSALENQGGEERIKEAINKYVNTIEIGVKREIKENKVKDAYVRLRVNQDLYNVDISEEISENENIKKLDEELKEEVAIIETAKKVREETEETEIEEETETYETDEYDTGETNTIRNILDLNINRNNFEDVNKNLSEKTNNTTFNDEENDFNIASTTEDTTEEATEEATEDTTEEEATEETTEEATEETTEDTEETEVDKKLKSEIKNELDDAVKEATTIDIDDRYENDVYMKIGGNEFPNLDLRETDFSLVNLDSINSLVSTLINNVSDRVNKEYYIAEKQIAEEELDDRLEREKRLDTIEELISKSIKEEVLNIDLDNLMNTILEEDKIEDNDNMISNVIDETDIKKINFDTEEDTEFSNDFNDIAFKDSELSINNDDEETTEISLLSVSEDFKEIAKSTKNYRDLLIKVVLINGVSYEGRVIKQEENYYILKIDKEEDYYIRIYKNSIEKIDIIDSYKNILTNISPIVFKDSNTIYNPYDLVQGQAYSFEFSNGEKKGIFIKIKGKQIIITLMDNYDKIAISINSFVSATLINSS